VPLSLFFASLFGAFCCCRLLLVAEFLYDGYVVVLVLFEQDLERFIKELLLVIRSSSSSSMQYAN
jgi:hypothetical protein